ncbi:hypothetical protein QOZ80_5BG0455530 [Eleusine coracana subsp. coracana]|nr:hypothetical protein QOZ80_5BG0455530 [Eleusine coracana subsp. coracana]
MVVLHVKSTAHASAPSPPESEREETEFLYECAAVTDVAAALGALAGLQARLLSLCRQLRERCVDASAAGELERALDETEAYASKELTCSLESCCWWREPGTITHSNIAF